MIVDGIYQQDTETVIDLGEAVDRDLEGFLDLLDELTIPPNGTHTEDGVTYELGPLMETDYTIVGLSDEQAIRLQVTGTREATPE